MITVNIFDRLSIEEGMKIGDLGCGNLGYFSLPAAELVGDKGVVYAVDVLKNVLESVDSRARRRGLDNIKTVWSNLELVGATDIPSESLDFAFLINILFQAENHQAIFQEAYRLLKVGGRLLIIDWLRRSSPFGPEVSRRPKKEELKKIADYSGFKAVDEFEAGRYHYGLIFRK